MEIGNKPAIVVAAFGSSRRGKTALDHFNKKLESQYPGYAVYWGFTSTIIRKKTGNPSLDQTLAKVAAEGHQQAVVLPLQIFPGSEYQKIAAITKKYTDIHILLGETLLHQRGFFPDVLQVIQQDFLGPNEGVNIIALHGTAAGDDVVNSLYSGFVRLLSEKYKNVLAAALEGAPDSQAVFHKAMDLRQRTQCSKLRIIPFMYTAGLHVEDDLMGAEGSWKSRLSEMGFDVECLTTELSGEKYFKSLASYEGIQEIFLQRLNSIFAISNGV